MLYNDAYRLILGSKHPQSLGQAGRECWPEIWDIIGPMLEGVLGHGESTWSDDQLLLLERHGYPEECYFTFSYSPIRDESGGIGGVFTAVTETTQRVLGERRVQTLRELAAHTGAARTAEEAGKLAAEALASNSADLPFTLLYLLDTAGETAQLAGMTGMPPGLVADLPPLDLRDHDRPDTDLLAQAVQTGASVVVDNLPAGFGSLAVGPAALESHTAVILPVAQPGQERAAGLLIAGLNPRHAFDDDYRGFLELVAGQVATAVANARAYEEAQARAEALAEIDRAKTLFFSNVSHEFRTPLTLLLGPLEDALSDAGLAADNRQRLEIAHRNALRLLRLVNMLLDFSRIEAGRIGAIYEPVDLAAFTADLTSVFRSAVERAGLRLVVECPPLAEPVYVDREMWEKIVLNLLSNAFKFTFAGEIAVSLRQVDNRVELAVRDTGTGIPPEELPHLFERFHRVRGAQGRTFEGTGIGLALVQELVHLHGGSIAVTSQVGAGTTFTVTLPLGKDHLPPDSIRPTETARATGSGAAPYLAEAQRWTPDASSTGETPMDGWQPPQDWAERAGAPMDETDSATTTRPYILLADDNADMRDYVCRLLSAHWDVEAVPTGAAALQAARIRVPDLVLSDVMMPGLDGFALLRELRADPHIRTVPVILLSARAGEEAAVEGLAAGADDYLIKPFSAAELLARVRSHLELARLRAEALQTAQDALRIRDQFLSIAAHELKTPLTSLLGYAQFLRRRIDREESLSERDRRAVTVIVEQSRRLSKLIDSLLDISRIRMGQFAIEHRLIDLTRLVRQVVEEIQPMLEKHTVEVRGDEVPVLIEGDALRLEQVLQNLIQNAIKYSPAGGPIVVTLDQHDKAATVAVRDPGIGIPQADIERLFQPFYRASNVDESPIGGMGVGLYVVHEIVALHNGTVAIESVEGQGSTFTIRLPLPDHRAE